MNVIKTSFLALFTAVTLSMGTVFAQEVSDPAPVETEEITVAVLLQASGVENTWIVASEKEYADPQECWAAARAFNVQAVGTGFLTVCFPFITPVEPAI